MRAHDSCFQVLCSYFVHMIAEKMCNWIQVFFLSKLAIQKQKRKYTTYQIDNDLWLHRYGGRGGAISSGLRRQMLAHQLIIGIHSNVGKRMVITMQMWTKRWKNQQSITSDQNVIWYLQCLVVEVEIHAVDTPSDARPQLKSTGIRRIPSELTDKLIQWILHEGKIRR